jgi:membrane associated rhomboid family serine protease
MSNIHQNTSHRFGGGSGPGGRGSAWAQTSYSPVGVFPTLGELVFPEYVYQLSCVICHLSSVICHLSVCLFVCRLSLSPPPPPVSLSLTHTHTFCHQHIHTLILIYSFRKTALTTWITIAQILAFAITLIVGQAKFDGAFVASNSTAGPSAATLQYMGAKYGPAIYTGQIWRIVTPILLHAGLSHLLLNLFFQLRLGFSMEQQWGAMAYIHIYVLGGIGASLFSCVCAPAVISVGASGALFALLGAQLSYLTIHRHSIINAMDQARAVLIVIVINLFFGMSPIGTSARIDNYAHVGGVITGCFAGVGIISNDQSSTMTRNAARVGLAVFLMTCCVIFWTSGGK